MADIAEDLDGDVVGFFVVAVDEVDEFAVAFVLVVEVEEGTEGGVGGGVGAFDAFEEGGFVAGVFDAVEDGDDVGADGEEDGFGVFVEDAFGVDVVGFHPDELAFELFFGEEAGVDVGGGGGHAGLGVVFAGRVR